MHDHRNACRAYAEAYRTKLISKKFPTDVKNAVELYEEKLDLFNLLLIRNRIDLEVEKSGILEKQEENSGGWFSGWFSSKKDDDADNKNKDIGEEKSGYFF